MIFVDTSAWFALMDRSCREHETVRGCFAASRDVLVTTDYVLAETLTLLRARHRYQEAIEFGTRLFSQTLAQLIWVSTEDVERAWILFQYRDKAWSFVDCVSFAVIQHLGIQDAFAFDDHFRQFGAVRVHPQ